MKPVKINLLIYLIYWKTYESQSRLTYEIDPFDIITEKLGAALSDCEKLRINDIIVLRDSPQSFQWTSKSLTKLSLVNFGNSYDDVQFKRDSRWPEKVDAAIIITPSQENLRNLLEKFKQSVWWNPSVLLILLDNHTIKTGCQNAFSFLQNAWKYDLLSSTFFCIDPENGFTMFTYNPFTKYAPELWQEVATNNTSHEHHSATFYRQRFIPGKTACENFTFDKTRNLGGYSIKVAGATQEQFGGIDGIITGLIFSKLNNTVNITSPILKNKSFNEYIEELSIGNHDFLLKAVFTYSNMNETLTYAHFFGGLSAITRHPSQQPAYRKIVTFMNPIFIAGLIAVCCGTAIILCSFTNEGLISASLEVLRMMLGVAMLHIPRRNSWRIYMVSVLITYVVSVATFQSNLASLLTSSVPLNPVDTIDSLKQTDYPIYIFPKYIDMINDEVLRSRVKRYRSRDCSKEVLENEKEVACIGRYQEMMKVALKKNLHLSMNKNLPSSYICRPNWPLRERVSSMLMHLFETGLTDQAMNIANAQQIYQWSSETAAMINKDYKTLKLSDLAFAFYILFFGLVISALAFLADLLTWRLEQNRK